MTETSMEVRKPWERLPGETNKAYRAFQVYLMLPIAGDIDERRSLKNTAARLGLASTTGVADWSAKYDWVARATAYDEYNGAKAIDLRETGLVELQQAVITSLGAQIALLNGLIEKKLAEASRDNLPLRDVKMLAEIIEKKDNLARRLAGLPTQYTTERAEDLSDEDTVYIIGAPVRGES